MKLLLIWVTWALLVVFTLGQRCRDQCIERTDYLCGRTIRNGHAILCTFRNPCIMDLHACRKREVWSKVSTGRCPRDTAGTACT